MNHTTFKILSAITLCLAFCGCADDRAVHQPIMAGSQVQRMRHAQAAGGVTIGPAVTGVASPTTEPSSTRGQSIQTTPGAASPGGSNSPPASESGLDRNPSNAGAPANQPNTGGSTFGPTSAPSQAPGMPR